MYRECWAKDVRFVEVTGSEMDALETAGFAVVIGTVRDAAASRIVSSSPPEFISCD